MPTYWVTVTATYNTLIFADSPKEAKDLAPALSEGRNGWSLAETVLSTQIYEEEEDDAEV